MPRDDLFTALLASGAESLPSRTVPGKKRQSCITAVLHQYARQAHPKGGQQLPLWETWQAGYYLPTFCFWHQMKVVVFCCGSQNQTHSHCLTYKRQWARGARLQHINAHKRGQMELGEQFQKDSISVDLVSVLPVTVKKKGPNFYLG